MASPKKVKSSVSADGIEDRKQVLERHGIPRAFLDQKRPKCVGADDLVDATACALIALRIQAGTAEPFPKDFERDSKGLRMAIRA